MIAVSPHSIAGAQRAIAERRVATGIAQASTA
jgi:hypothetical protein